jgi:tetratricopeptide (TPR) repeat protein
MKISNRTPQALIALVWLATTVPACAALTAKKHVGAGQKAEAAGDLAAAIREYEAAVAAAPNNAEYLRRLEEAQASGARQQADAARAAEAQGDWSTAAGHWRSAHAFQRTAEHQARYELATVRSQRTDPLDLYLATAKVAASVPQDAELQRSLAEAQSAALKYYFRLAETYFDGGSFDAAYDAYEAARKVKPEDEAWKSLKYRITRARHYETVGDTKLKGGDALAAYQAYETAAQSADLPGLAGKMERAKKGAGSLIEQLEQARAAERLQKWEDAAELFTILRDRPEAPKDVAESAVRTRKESAKLRSDRALALAKQGQADKAATVLTLAVEHTDAAEPTLVLLREGVAALGAARPGEAVAKFEAASAAAPMVAPAGVVVAEALARDELEAAKSLAAADPAEAMVRVARLEPLKAKLPGYDQVRAALVKRAFVVLIERAEKGAAEGRSGEAAEQFVTALSVAKVPDALAASLGAGAKALSARDFVGAEAAFREAETKDAKSRLAKTGLTIARGLAIAALRQEALAARGVEDTLREASALRGILERVPDDGEAQAALEALRPAIIERSLAAAEAHKAGERPGSAYVFVRRVLELDPKNTRALDLLTRLSGSFDQRPTALGWVPPVLRGNRLADTCPGSESDLRDRIILYLTKTPKLGADYLQREPTRDIDAGKRGAPSLELVAALEHCAVNSAGGAVGVSMQLRLAGKPLAQESVSATFDPSMLPKDERSEKLDEAKMRQAAMKEAARLVALAVQKHAAAMEGWRVAEAKARLAKADDEAVARSYATLVLAGDKLPPAEREVLRELERYVLLKFR